LKPKLRTYAVLKRELKFEPYLDVYHRGGIPELAKIRGGTNRLRIEQGRYQQEPLERRVCVLCSMKQVEDEYHFMLECPVYEDLRNLMWAKFEALTGQSRSTLGSKCQQLNALIGDQFQPAEGSDQNSKASSQYRTVAKSIMVFITTAMNRRRRLLE